MSALALRRTFLLAAGAAALLASACASGDGSAPKPVTSSAGATTPAASGPVSVTEPGATPTPAPRGTAVQTPAAAAGPALAAPNVTPRTLTLTGHGVPVVVLDPGHGGDESGAAAYGVIERDSNLDMAQRAATYLRAAGVDVVLTRETEARAAGSGSSFGATRADLQARVSLANQVKGAVFVSLHSNGSGDSSARGVEVYWESRRPWANENLRLAQALLSGVTDSLAAAGYPTRNRGTIDAACWRNNNGRCVGLFVLSPEGTPTSGTAPGATPAAKEATNMPAALVESLFISNAEDASLLRTEAARDAIARGLSSAILRYLGIAG